MLGGGAAGLMCAIEAGKRGRRVTVLEHSARVGRKILISGGGRCNFTNLHTTAGHFISGNPHFAKSALARYRPADFIAMIERHGIPYHEKTLGQLFCDRSAEDVVTMLERECAAVGVKIVTGCTVHAIRPGYSLETSAGPLEAASVVVATGGLSIPKLGATPLGYRIAEQFRLQIAECRPALVPLTFQRADAKRYDGLAGVSTLVDATADGHTFREKLLFTHRGLSGPAILQASSYWRPGNTLRIDLLPGVDFARVAAEARAAREKLETRTLLSRYLPKRLADRWFELGGGSRPMAAASDRELERIAASLRCWEVAPAGSEGYEKAEVTAGGVDTAGLSSQTMEARDVPGLYFVGEVVDVTGHLGGFNFQWAWASGYSAGQHA